MASAETPPPAFGDYYREIYAKEMLAGERPTLPMAWAELEERAREALDDRAIAYVFGGAGSEDTMRANLQAFRRWRIVPSVLGKRVSAEVSYHCSTESSVTPSGSPPSAERRLSALRACTAISVGSDRPQPTLPDGKP